ncbi:MAG: TOBE domain-containing protein [Paracoccaceae bacterium]
MQLKIGHEFLLARITQRSATNLALTEGVAVFAVLKSVAVAPGDIGVV